MSTDSINIEFKSLLPQEEVYSLIIDTLRDDEIKNIIEKNKAARLQCKAFNLKSYKYNRSDTIKNISELCKKVKSVKESVNKMWNIDRKVKQKKLDNIKTEEEFNSLYLKEKSNINVLKSITIYWASEDDELNKLGDKLYERYKNGEFDINEEYKSQEDGTMKNDESIGSNNINDDILSMNFGQVIERFSKYELRIAELEAKIDEKTQENQQLKETVKSVSDYKNLKKDINNINKTISQSSESIIKENEALKKELKIIDSKNNELKELLAKQSKIIESLNNDNLNKQVSTLIQDSQNTIKSLLVENTKKITQDIKEYIDETLLLGLEKQDKSSEANKGITEPEKAKTVSEKTPPIKDEFGDLDDILGGLNL